MFYDVSTSCDVVCAKLSLAFLVNDLQLEKPFGNCMIKSELVMSM